MCTTQREEGQNHFICTKKRNEAYIQRDIYCTKVYENETCYGDALFSIGGMPLMHGWMHLSNQYEIKMEITY